MRILTGTDIIEIDRIEKSLRQFDSSFLNKIYTQNEIKYCESKKKSKYQHYAARFAAKEATYKAVSALLENKFELDWTDMEITNLKDGRPIVHITNDKLNQKIENIDISISHCQNYAVANVVLCCK